MKKNLTVLAFLLCAAIPAQAQIELKTIPIALLFEVFPVSLEFNINSDWGTEIDIWAASGGGLVYFSGKYYFDPKRGADRFNIGMFGGYYGGGGDSGGGVGFFAGYKAVSQKNVLLEVALGIGRDFVGDIDVLPYGKLHLGYRFGRKSN